MTASPLLYTTENINHLLKEEQIIGHYVYDMYDENLGRIKGLLVESKTFFLRYIVYTQGGILSIGGKIILVPQEMFNMPEFGKVKLFRSIQWIKDIPSPHDIEALTREEEELVLDYFNLPKYWEEESWEETGQGLPS